MAEVLASAKLDADSHLLLDQPLLKVPYELLRKNFKSAQRNIEKERDQVLGALKSAALNSSTSPDTLENILARLEGLKRKLENLRAEEKILHEHSRRRIEHLEELHQCHSLTDVKYEKWSKVRLSRLLVDYLLRRGYLRSAEILARDDNIQELVDVHAFVGCRKIEDGLLNGKTSECLAWCSENRQALKKTNSNLEFELRLQQYIEMLRGQKLIDAQLHARRYLVSTTELKKTKEAAALLAYRPGTQIEPYKTLYSGERWKTLAKLFVETHHSLMSLPSAPALHVALTAGLSALKTPSCHSSHASSSSSANTAITTFASGPGGGVCPICSTELNALAKGVPYAHHSKSNVEVEPVVLPNGRLYGRGRLDEFSTKIPTPSGKVRDPTNPEQLYDVDQVKKVYIS